MRIANLLSFLICVSLWLPGCGCHLPNATVPTDEASVAEPVSISDTWRDLFDGKTLTQWKSTRSGGEGGVDMEEGALSFPFLGCGYHSPVLSLLGCPVADVIQRIHRIHRIRRFRPTRRLWRPICRRQPPHPTVPTDETPVAEPVSNSDIWRELFDGKTLTHWNSTRFGGEGDVDVEEGVIRLDFGQPLTGITYQGNDLPKNNYEIQLEAKRVDGLDFFCALTFPVARK